MEQEAEQRLVRSVHSVVVKKGRLCIVGVSPRGSVKLEEITDDRERPARGSASGSQTGPPVRVDCPIPDAAAEAYDPVYDEGDWDWDEDVRPEVFERDHQDASSDATSSDADEPLGDEEQRQVIIRNVHQDDNGDVALVPMTASQIDEHGLAWGAAGWHGGAYKRPLQSASSSSGQPGVPVQAHWREPAPAVNSNIPAWRDEWYAQRTRSQSRGRNKMAKKKKRKAKSYVMPRHRKRVEAPPFDPTLGFEGQGPQSARIGRKKAGRPMKQSSQRDVGRGPEAWSHGAQDGLAQGGQRLLAHTISDSSAVRQYLPAARGFIEFGRKHELACGTWVQLDEAMLQYLGQMCYVDKKNVQQGVLAVNGVVYLYPNASREMPQSWRALKGWSIASITAEGQPVAMETLACMEDYLRNLGTDEGTQAADCMPLAVDGYLREQDLFQLRVEDVLLQDNAEGTRVATLLLGRGERGERCKSGRDQGVVMDEPYSAEILEKRVREAEAKCFGPKVGARDRRAKARIFTIKADAYRRLWKIAALAVTGNKEGAGVPHSARHTGATRDMTLGYRTVEQVMKRGRWKALSSVNRYAKPHAWYQAMSKQSDEVLERGALLLAARAPRATKLV